MAEKISIGAKEPLYKAAEKINGAIDEVNTFQTQIDQLVIEGDSSVEAAQARVDADGVAHTTLKERLDTEHNEVTAQLAQAEQEVFDLKNAKADKIELNKKSPIQFGSEVFKIPSDYPTLQSAIDELSERKPKQGTVINILIESGHYLKNGLRLADGDYSHFIIQSEEGVVYLDPSFIGVSNEGLPSYVATNDNLIVGINARMPVLNTVIDMQKQHGTGIDLVSTSIMTVKENGGVINAGKHGANIRNSRFWGAYTIWTGAVDTGVRFEQGASGSLQGADFSNCEYIGCLVSRGSNANLHGAKGNNCGRHGLNVRRSICNAESGEFQHNGWDNVLVEHGSVLVLDDGDVRNQGSGYNAINVRSGATVSVTGTITNNGTPSAQDTPIPELNLPTGRGILVDQNSPTVIPRINFSNIFNETQTFRTSKDGLSSSDGVRVDRNNTNQQNNGFLADFIFSGRNNVQNIVDYARIQVMSENVSSGSEKGRFGIRTRVNGSDASRILVGEGLYTPNASGGDKGPDTINAKEVYDDNVLLTCYVIEKWLTGEINLDFWDEQAVNNKHLPARNFEKVADERLDIDRYYSFVKENKHLPAFPSQEDWKNVYNGKVSTGDLIQRLWETVEVQAVHISTLNERMKKIESNE